jgi:hypothetical protein
VSRAKFAWASLCCTFFGWTLKTTSAKGWFGISRGD